MSKQEEYLQLIMEMKNCHICKDIKAPVYCENGECLENDQHGITEDGHVDFQKIYVNRWNLWHGNLDADIMVIGQDYGKFDHEDIPFTDWQDKNEEKQKFHTDQTLCDIFREVFGDPFDLHNRELPLYFTNLACCYRKNRSTGSTNDAWFSICARRYMGRLIRIIHPKIIVALGMKTFEHLAFCKEMQLVCISDEKPAGNLTFEKLLDKRYLFVLKDNLEKNEIPVVPVFHPGANMARNRKWDKVIEDWKVVKDHYDRLGTT